MSESLMIDRTVSPLGLCSFPENQARQATLLLVWTRMALEATYYEASFHALNIKVEGYASAFLHQSIALTATYTEFEAGIDFDSGFTRKTMCFGTTSNPLTTAFV